MTVLPFAPRSRPRPAGAGPGPTPATPVRGTFASPRGGTGSFRGAYLLEHLLPGAGHVAVRGVFTGELTDGNGERVGIAARRRTTPVDLGAAEGCLLVRIAGLDVDLNGLLVGVEPFAVHVEGTSVERAARASLGLLSLSAELVT